MKVTVALFLAVFIGKASMASTTTYLVTDTQGDLNGNAITAGQTFAGSATLTLDNGDPGDVFALAELTISTTGVLISFADTNSTIEVSESITLEGDWQSGTALFFSGAVQVTDCVVVQGPDRCASYSSENIFMGIFEGSSADSFSVQYELFDADIGIGISPRSFELTTTPVPVPASVWMFVGALGYLRRIASPNRP